MKPYIPSLAGFRRVCVSASLLLLPIGVATAAPAGGDESPAAEGSYGFQPQTLRGSGGEQTRSPGFGAPTFSSRFRSLYWKILPRSAA